MSHPASETDLEMQIFFGTQGKLAGCIPDYQVRYEQIELAETIQEALETEQHCLAEAGTGVGKSLAYLIPGIVWALENKTRLLISTHTKALQAQLMTKELPRLAEYDLFGRPFRYEICLGTENYVCLLRLLREGNQEQLPGFDPEYGEQLHQCLQWCKEDWSGIRADCPEPVQDAVWQRICIVNELCIQRQCAYFEDCYLQKARKRQREAHVLVANHYLFFSNLITDGRLLPEYKAAVLDEAHKLEDVATQFLGDSLAQYEIQSLLAEFGKRNKHAGLDMLQGLDSSLREKIREKATVLSAKQEKWWKSLLNLFHTNQDTLRMSGSKIPVTAPDTEMMLALAQDLYDLQDTLETEEDVKVLAFYAARLADAARVEKQWFERDSQETVYWIEKFRSRLGPQVRLQCTPLDLSDRCSQLIFETIPSVSLTSATMAVQGDFSYLRSRLGIPEALEVVTASPFPYEQNAALYLPTDIPDPKQAESYEKYVMTAVEELIDTFHGGVFVLCTSYRMLHRTADYLREQDSRHVYLVQGEAPPHRLLDYFRKDRNAVMLGVETFWQGVDVPGDALRCVIITRLPFDVPTHPIHQARADYLSQAGDNPFLCYSVPRAALMLRQGFGRLIRRHEDKGIVVILDPRVMTRDWGSVFISSLPKCPRLHHMDQVQAFVKQHFSLEDSD